MKTFVCLCFTLLVSAKLFAQSPFKNISFSEAVLEAEKTGKLIFIQFESVTCNQCNEVADKAFENKELANRVNQDLVSIKIPPSHKDRDALEELYNIENNFGVLFIDKFKTLIHQYSGSTTLAKTYNDQIEIALLKSGESVRISQLEKEYSDGDSGHIMMKTILVKKKSLGLDTDKLLDKYVASLPEDSLISVSSLIFISTMTPVIGSNADNILRRNNSLFNRAWYTLSLSERVKNNNLILFKSLNKAISEKNESYARRVASFAQSTFTNAPMAGSKAYDSHMLKYFKAVNDKENYLLNSVAYYDKYLMTVSVDSIKNIDSINRVRLLKNTPGDTIYSGPNKFSVSKKVVVSGRVQSFSGELNEGAKNIYNLSTEKFYITKALQFAKRAVAFFESPQAMDTYARLLYKTSDVSNAIIWETKAIELRKKTGFPVKENEATLAKMQSGVSLTE